MLELLTSTNIFREKYGKDANGFPYPTNNDDPNDTDQTYFQYITFRIIAKVTAVGSNGNFLTSKDIILTTAKNWKWFDTNPGESDKTEYKIGLAYAPGTSANQGGR